jgi:hypothetical protein
MPDFEDTSTMSQRQKDNLRRLLSPDPSGNFVGESQGARLSSP